MPSPRLASRYAKSLIDLSIEKGQLENVYTDMQWLQELCRVSPELVSMLRSPVINADKKQKIMQAITSGKVGEIVAGFNRLLISKNRESILPEIITAFITSYKAHKNIHIVKLTTASPVSDAIKNEIIEQVKKSAGYENIELVATVKEELIGGFILQTGDQRVDASVAYDLKYIARQFENNDFIYKLR